jgi:hypothetical protein
MSWPLGPIKKTSECPRFVLPDLDDDWVDPVVVDVDEVDDPVIVDVDVDEVDDPVGEVVDANVDEVVDPVGEVVDADVDEAE